MATYNRKSPYYTASQNTGYLGVISDFKNIPALANDIYWEITPQYKYRPDLLAYDIYEDTALWWVFAVRNKDVIRDPVYDMIPGTKIFIPQLATIKKSLGL